MSQAKQAKAVLSNTNQVKSKLLASENKTNTTKKIFDFADKVKDEKQNPDCPGAGEVSSNFTVTNGGKVATVFEFKMPDLTNKANKTNDDIAAMTVS